MPVEAADIVRTVMDIGVYESTWCEETATGFVERVRKWTRYRSFATVSNGIHIPKSMHGRKAWKSGQSSRLTTSETNRYQK